MKHILQTLAIITVVLLVLVDRSSHVKAQTVVDQSFTSPNNLGAAINECCAFVAQTFTAGLSGTLAGVNINVIPSENSPFALHVAIDTVTSTGEPSSLLTGTRSITPALVLEVLGGINAEAGSGFR